MNLCFQIVLINFLHYQLSAIQKHREHVTIIGGRMSIRYCIPQYGYEVKEQQTGIL